jgi:hypothetical protein
VFIIIPEFSASVENLCKPVAEKVYGDCCCRVSLETMQRMRAFLTSPQGDFSLRSNDFKPGSEKLAKQNAAQGDFSLRSKYQRQARSDGCQQ